VPVLVFVFVPPRVRVRVRVLLELARAAGWIAENTLMWCDLLFGDGHDATSVPGSASLHAGKEQGKSRSTLNAHLGES
jgi:hypothetical protein